MCLMRIFREWEILGCYERKCSVYASCPFRLLHNPSGSHRDTEIGKEFLLYLKTYQNEVTEFNIFQHII